MTLEDIIYYEKKDAHLENIFELLEDYGEVSDVLKKKISEETEFDILKAWHKLAAKVESISEFEQKMDEVKTTVLRNRKEGNE